MKSLKLLAGAGLALALAPWAFAGNAGKYDDLIAKGFRWATADGPYATIAEEDAHKVVGHLDDHEILKMVEQVKVYYLTPGTIVQVTAEDPKSGTSKIRMAGITSDLWTLTRFLSKRPVRDTYGVVETPENSGLIPNSGGIDAGPTPTPSFGPSATPGASPLPGMSPLPDVSPLPDMSPLPDTTPLPDTSPTPAPTPVPNAIPSPAAAQ